jgi:hypothetical protein
MARGMGIEDRIFNETAINTGDDALAPQQLEANAHPVYKKFPEARIPVSKKLGTLWKSRRDAALRKLEQSGRIENWEEAIRYYKNDQRPNFRGRPARTRRERGRKSGVEAENIVFANTTALVPSIYAKNPSCEITANVHDDAQEGGPDDEMRRVATVCERLVNALAVKKAAPGFNLKPKARKSVVMANLTNIAYIEIGWTPREQSSEQALQELDDLARRYAQPKDSKELEEIEGALLALEETVDFLNPAGPWCKFRHPKDVLTDPDATEADGTDAAWRMIADYLPTAQINATYRLREGDEWRSMYKPTHVAVSASGKEIEEEINNFSILKGQYDYKSWGFDSEDEFNKAARTKVWKVWDKVTRRVYMYADDDWSWPIWIWDDPYELDTFFPVYALQFYTDPEDDIGLSEVVYYLDQQDAINDVNAEMRKIRRRAFGKLFYNKNVIKNASVIDAYMKGDMDDKAVGVDSPADAELQKALFALVPPSAQYKDLFNKEWYYSIIQKISSVQPVMQGEQFKTNTTNEAIETYNSTQQTRLDEKIDCVEDFVGDIFWGIAQLCLRFMPAEQVASILGPNDAQGWRNFTSAEIRTGISVQVVGGSSQKPTSRAKKQEAIQMGQVLGQYAQAGQGAVIMLILKVFEQAFDELTISEEDWKFLGTAIQQQIANSNPQGQPGAEGQPGAQDQSPPGSPDAVIAQVAQLVDGMTPEAKLALGKALSQGVPVMEALPRIMEMQKGMLEQAPSGQAGPPQGTAPPSQALQ